MAQVRTGVNADDLGPGHEKRPVGLLNDILGLERTGEAGPAGAGLELIDRTK